MSARLAANTPYQKSSRKTTPCRKSRQWNFMAEWVGPPILLLKGYPEQKSITGLANGNGTRNTLAAVLQLICGLLCYFFSFFFLNLPLKVVKVRVWALPFWPRLWSHELGWHVWAWTVHVAEVHTMSQACILDSAGRMPALLSDSHGYCRRGISYLSHHAQQRGQSLNNSAAESCLFFPPSFGGGGTSLGAGIAQWLQCRTLDWKVAGSNPCWSGGRIFFSRVNFLCRLLFRYPFHPRVTTAACKRSWSFCQKCRWQVTAKHTYILHMWLCMKWHGA